MIGYWMNKESSFIALLSFVAGSIIGQMHMTMYRASPPPTSVIAEITLSQPHISGQIEEVLEGIRNDTTIQDAATLLERRIRILCLVMTVKASHTTKASNVKTTWGNKCTKLVFLSDAEDRSLSAIDINSQSKTPNSWSKLSRGLQWAHDNHLNYFDWVFTTDDETYTVMENLRALLAQYNLKEAIYFDRTLITNTSVYSVGAGIALNKMALIKLTKEAFLTTNCNPSDGYGMEHMGINECFRQVGISPVDTSIQSVGNWFRQHDPLEFREVSPQIDVTFNKLNPAEMVTLHYFVNRFHLFGRNVYIANGTKLSGLEQSYAVISKAVDSNGYAK